MTDRKFIEDTLEKAFIGPYRNLAMLKLEQAKASWNPFRRLRLYGFVEGLEAAADLVFMLGDSAATKLEKRKADGE